MPTIEDKIRQRISRTAELVAILEQAEKAVCSCYGSSGSLSEQTRFHLFQAKNTLQDWQSSLIDLLHNVKVEMEP